MRSTTDFVCFPCILALILSVVICCGNDDDSGTCEDSDTDTDTDTGTDPNGVPGTRPASETCDDFAVEVRYYDESEIVELAGLPTYTFDGRELILLMNIVNQTSFNPNTDYLRLDFKGCDGSMPDDHPFCEDISISHWVVNTKGNGLEVSTLDLYWRPGLEFPDCMFIKEVAVIYVDD